MKLEFDLISQNLIIDYLPNKTPSPSASIVIRI